MRKNILLSINPAIRKSIDIIPYSQEMIAYDMERNQSTISRWYRGASSPSIEDAILLDITSQQCKILDSYAEILHRVVIPVQSNIPNVDAANAIHECADAISAIVDVFENGKVEVHEIPVLKKELREAIAAMMGILEKYVYQYQGTGGENDTW